MSLRFSESASLGRVLNRQVYSEGFQVSKEEFYIMPGKRILIVDDEVNVGTSLRLVLEGSGYTVQLCRTAA